jgi:hypothetical protein
MNLYHVSFYSGNRYWIVEALNMFHAEGITKDTFPEESFSIRRISA